MSNVPKNLRSIITTDPLLWIWSKNSSGANPIKIRISFKRKRKYYSIKYEGKNLFLSQYEWDEIQNHSIKLRGEKKNVRLAVFGTVSNAETAITQAVKNNRPFTFERFEKEFLNQESEMCSRLKFR